MECTICQERFSHGDTILKVDCTCNYFYHTNCLDQWLDTNNSCPLCRAIPEYKLTSIFNEEYATLSSEKQILALKWDTITIQIEFEEDEEDYNPNQIQIQVYRMNYNILRYRYGMAGLAYST